LQAQQAAREIKDWEPALGTAILADSQTRTMETDSHSPYPKLQTPVLHTPNSRLSVRKCRNGI